MGYDREFEIRRIRAFGLASKATVEEVEAVESQKMGRKKLLAENASALLGSQKKLASSLAKIVDMDETEIMFALTGVKR